METTVNTMNVDATVNGMITANGYGASGDLIGGKTLEPMEIKRNPPPQYEVLIEMLYCGICHSDVHQVANDWKTQSTPTFPAMKILEE